MPSKGGGYAAAPAPAGGQGGDRFYNPPQVRRQQLQQQEMMQRELLQQQHQQQQQQNQVQQLEQRRQMQRHGKVKGKAEHSSSKAAVEAEKPNGGDDSSMVVAALPVPRSVNPAPTVKLSNLDRVMESVTPFVEARYSSEVHARGFRSTEVDSCTFFYLEDLWDSFGEWSAYGQGVPLLLNGRDPVKQYYVPYLSGIQLYIDPSKASRGHSQDIDADLNRLKIYSVSSASSKADVTGSSSLPLFQFLEKDSPYERRPLYDQLMLLASQSPELSKCRSCDLLPTSWICIAWYPIYRIPVGSTLKDLGASFLVFHSLSTQPRSNLPPPQLHQANTRDVGGFFDPMARVSLPVFALATCRQKGSILHPCGPQESEQENCLFQAADDWLRRLHVGLPDYDHFWRRRSQWR